MQPLKLFNFHLAPYAVTFINGKMKENAANAYIYYTGQPQGLNPDDPYDHEGKPIGTFMDEARRRSLEEHVRNVIMPAINAGFIYTPFIVVGVDFTNMAPHPHLVIKCRDNRPLEESDLAQMEAKLEKIIQKLNQPELSATLFTQPAKKIDAAVKPQHHYNLRSH